MNLSQPEQSTGRSQWVRCRVATSRKRYREVEASVEAAAELSQVARQMLGLEPGVNATATVRSLTDIRKSPARRVSTCPSSAEQAHRLGETD